METLDGKKVSGEETAAQLYAAMDKLAQSLWQLIKGLPQANDIWRLDAEMVALSRMHRVAELREAGLLLD